MIHVVAIVTAQSGQRSLLLEAFRAIIPLVRTEKGCIEYNATVDVAGAAPAFGPDTFVVIEKWESLEALSEMAHRLIWWITAPGQRIWLPPSPCMFLIRHSAPPVRSYPLSRSGFLASVAGAEQ